MHSTQPIQHMRPTELAARWGCSVGHLANERTAGRGPIYVRLGRHIVYRLQDVEAYEAARIVRPVGAAGAAA